MSSAVGSEAEAGRRQSEERYAALFEQSPVATALTRLSDRVIVNVNSAFCRLFEFERDEILGRTTEELGVPLHSSRLPTDSEPHADDEPLHFECTRTTKSGAQRIVLLDTVALTADGERYVLSKVHDITEQRRAEEGARLYEQSRERLLDLDAMERLHRVSVRFFDEEGLPGVLDEILEAAIAITQADFGNIQVFDPVSSELTIVTARGFPDWWLEYWRQIRIGQGACGASIERKKRVIIEEVSRDPMFTAADVEIQLRAGVRAVQSTPLFDRSGLPLGAICTHYTTPQRPSDRSFRLLDLLARQAADILDRARREAEERRRDVEQRLLADVGGALSTLDYEHAMTSVAHAAAAALADFVVIFLVDEGSVQRVTAASRLPEHQEVIDRYVPLSSRPQPTHPVWQVIATGTTVIRPIDPAEYESMAESPEHLVAIRKTRPTSALFAPMLAGDSCVGALGLTSSSRQFDERDVRLAEEIGRRCALFLENARLHERNRRAIHTRSEVLGIVAHDLRNPLHSIVVNALVLDGTGADPESVESIRRAAKRMDRIIRDLLDVARFEAGTFEVERAHVLAADLVNEAARAHRKPILAAGLALRLDMDAELPPVWADRERVAQVFENLVSNAMRFTPAGTITIGARTQDDEVVFSVADTGDGIAAPNLPRMFDSFWQERHDKYGGAGLGLSIVKTIVDAHGGRAWATSELAAGSTFYFTLPIASPPTAAALGRENETARLALIVDDDAEVRLSLARLVRQEGYATATASNGQEALDYLRAGERPSVIILDLAMPVLDGWAFLEQRQLSPDLRSIPVIVISGQGDVTRRVAAMNAAFLPKPVWPETLIATMQTIRTAGAAAP